MRITLPLIGLLLLAHTAHAQGLTIPSAGGIPESHFVKLILDEVDNQLRNASGAPAAGPGTDYDSAMSRARAAARLRGLFVDIPAGASEPMRDIDRTVCFLYDIRLMERMLAGLIKEYLNSAEDLDAVATDQYYKTITYLWEKLWQVRQFALDPTARAPVFPNAGSGDTTASGDDALCPYDSFYAPMGFDTHGCIADSFAYISEARVLNREVTLLGQILTQLTGATDGLPPQLALYRGSLKNVWEDSYKFVQGISNAAAPRALKLFEPIYVRFKAQNIGESGCLGWDSDVSPFIEVTGDDVTLLNRFPGTTFTRELADTFAFLKLREEPEWREYVRDLNRRTEEHGAGAIGLTLPMEGLDDVNREHIARESHLMLSIRDPQIRVANIAQGLHERTRLYTSQAVILKGQKNVMPPLREFINRFYKFISHMCSNRGCGRTLLRANDLLHMDTECFSSFKAVEYFLKNPGAVTLPTCKSLLNL